MSCMLQRFSDPTFATHVSQPLQAMVHLQSKRKTELCSSSFNNNGCVTLATLFKFGWVCFFGGVCPISLYRVSFMLGVRCVVFDANPIRGLGCFVVWVWYSSFVHLFYMAVSGGWFELRAASCVYWQVNDFSHMQRSACVLLLLGCFFYWWPRISMYRFIESSFSLQFPKNAICT